MTATFRDAKQLRTTVETVQEIIATIPEVDAHYAAMIHDAEASRGIRSTSYDRNTTPGRSRARKTSEPDEPPSYSDPTGEAVVNGDRHLSQLRAARQQLHKDLLDMLKRFQAHAAKAHPAEVPVSPTVDDLWCVSCIRAKVFTPRGDAKKVGGAAHCRWCHDFKRDYGQLPSVELIRARSDGRRITEAMIEKTTR